MNVVYSRRFLREFASAPLRVQKSFEKQVELLGVDLSHPSLRAKKYNAAVDLWQARVNMEWRFYFTIEGGAYHLHSITAHPK